MLQLSLTITLRVNMLRTSRLLCELHVDANKVVLTSIHHAVKSRRPSHCKVGASGLRRVSCMISFKEVSVNLPETLIDAEQGTC